MAEPIKTHKIVTGQKLTEEISSLLEQVKLSSFMSARYPNEFSGGQRQRIAIARALALKPNLVVCDEPLSALDVSTQLEITELLLNLQKSYGLTYVFISHDLAMVRYVSDRIMVMYLGKVVELGSAIEITEHPQHPYTQALLSAIPLIDPVIERKRQRIILKGDVPSALNPPKGCHFHPRCWASKAGICSNREPILKEIATSHFVSCHLFE